MRRRDSLFTNGISETANGRVVSKMVPQGKLESPSQRVFIQQKQCIGSFQKKIGCRFYPSFSLHRHETAGDLRCRPLSERMPRSDCSIRPCPVRKPLPNSPLRPERAIRHVRSADWERMVARPLMTRSPSTCAWHQAFVLVVFTTHTGHQPEELKFTLVSIR